MPKTPRSIAHVPAWTFVLGFAAGGLVVLWFVSPPPPHSGSTTAPRSTAGIEPGEPRGAPSAGGGSLAASAAREEGGDASAERAPVERRATAPDAPASSRPEGATAPARAEWDLTTLGVGRPRGLSLDDLWHHVELNPRDVALSADAQEEIRGLYERHMGVVRSLATNRAQLRTQEMRALTLQGRTRPLPDGPGEAITAGGVFSTALDGSEARWAPFEDLPGTLQATRHLQAAGANLLRELVTAFARAGALGPSEQAELLARIARSEALQAR